MGEKKSVIIIGAGIGGTATAAFLAKEGYKVDVYEKNPSAGGRCGQIIKEGHRFDLGATMLLMPEVYRQVFRSLDISFDEGSDMIPLEDLYKIYFDDGSWLAFTTNRQRMKLQLEALEPGSFEKSERYVSKGYEIFRLGMGKLIGRNFYSLFDMVNFSNVGLLLKLKVFISHWNYTKRFFSSQHLRMAYTFQNIYVGQSPFSSPALFSMVPAAELTEGSYFPKGGMYSILKKLRSKAEEEGAVFHFNAPVSRIITGSRVAESVELEDGTIIKSDIVIANADLPYSYRKLLPDKRKSARIDRLKYSCSAICFHWGLDRVYPELGHHSVFLSDSFRQGLYRIMHDKTISDDPSFYVHAPARTDPGAAPAGCDTLSVIVASGHADSKRNQDWPEIQKRARSAVIEKLKKHGLTGLEEHIKFEICHTPEDWANACNISRGAVFGSLGHNIFQMGWFRPHNRHDRYNNLYFTGGSTHPGNGIPNVLISARLVSERIIKENGR